MVSITSIFSNYNPLDAFMAFQAVDFIIVNPNLATRQRKILFKYKRLHFYATDFHNQLIYLVFSITIYAKLSLFPCLKTDPKTPLRHSK